MSRFVKAFVLFVVCWAPLIASAAPIYDGIPSPDPTGSPSLGYQATQTAEFGDRIAFAGTERNLTTVRVGLVSWAQANDNFDDPSLMRTPTDFQQQLTFNIYAVNGSGGVGALLATNTATFTIPFAPSASVHPFVPVTFDFSSQNVVLPNEVIYGLAFNTQTWGANPTGFSGPYNSLNFAVGGDNPALGSGGYYGPTVGSDVFSNAVFWNTSTAGYYTDGGAGGVGTFREDTNWFPYVPMVEFNAAAAEVPEPASLAVWSLIAAAGSVYGWRKRKVLAGA
jgi:hypothetical protein